VRVRRGKEERKDGKKESEKEARERKRGRLPTLISGTWVIFHIVFVYL
jgi:hypothetical protein